MYSLIDRQGWKELSIGFVLIIAMCVGLVLLAGCRDPFAPRFNCQSHKVNVDTLSGSGRIVVSSRPDSVCKV